jgi:hypothetical protein
VHKIDTVQEWSLTITEENGDEQTEVMESFSFPDTAPSELRLLGFYLATDEPIDECKSFTLTAYHPRGVLVEGQNV